MIDSFPHILLAATAFLQNISVRGSQKARIILTINSALECFLLASKSKSPSIRLVTGQSTIAKEFFEAMMVQEFNQLFLEEDTLAYLKKVLIPIFEQSLRATDHCIIRSHFMLLDALCRKKCFMVNKDDQAWCDREEIDLFRMLYQDTTMGDMIEDEEGIKLELKTMANVIFRNILSESPYVEKQFFIQNHYNETIELLVDLQIPSDIYYQNIQLLIKFMPRGVQKIDVRPIIKLLHQVFMRQYNPIRNPLTLEGIMWVIRECMMSIYQRNDNKLIAQTVDVNFAAALVKLVYKDSLFFNYALDILGLLSAHNKVLDLFRRIKFHQTILDLLLTKLNISDSALLNCLTIILYTIEHGFSVDDLYTLQSFVEAFHLQIDDRNSNNPIIQDCWLLMAQAKKSKEIGRIIDVEKAHAHLKVIEPIREDGSNRLHTEPIKDPRLRKGEHPGVPSSVVRATPPDCAAIDLSIEKVLKESKQYADREDTPASAPSMPPKQVFIKLVSLPQEKTVSKAKIVEVELDEEDQALQDITDEESALLYLRSLYVNCMVDDIVGERMKKAGIEDDGRLVETEEEIRRREEKNKEDPVFPSNTVVHFIHQKKPPVEVAPPGILRRNADQQFGYDSAFINLDMVNKKDDESTSYRGSRNAHSPKIESRNGHSAKEKTRGLGHTHQDLDYFSHNEKHSKVNVYISSN